jgi:S1-C subfamily serine protease
MKANQLISIFLLLLFFDSAIAQPLAAKNPTQIVTRDGTIYKSAAIQKVDPDGLTISYSMAGGGMGMAKLKFEDLPDELRQKYGYNSTNAAAFEVEQRQAVGQWRAQMIASEDEAKAKLHAARLADVEAEAEKSGTGFFITDDGFLLSCYHVVANTTHIMVNTEDDLYSAEVVSSDPANDVVLLKVEGSFHSLPFVSNPNVKLGDSIFTIGFPLISLQGVEPKLTKGEISSLTGLQDDPRAFQVSAAVQPGNSGGPLVDEYGNVVGIIAARISDEAAIQFSGMIPQNVNYAVKSSCAQAMLNSTPDLPVKLKKPYLAKERKFADVVQEAQEAVVLILAY